MSLNGLCFMSYLQRGHIEMGHPFNVPSDGQEAQFLHRTFSGSWVASRKRNC